MSEDGSRLGTSSFPAGTPLHVFFAWNEARRFRDRRFTVARDVYGLLTRFGDDAAAVDICVAHLAISPVVVWRWRRWMMVSAARAHAAIASLQRSHEMPAVIAARQLVLSLVASIGSTDVAEHAAVFRAFDVLETMIDISALARLRPQNVAVPPAFASNILVIKLSALGDFIQALGPAAAIRRHYERARITLLTTSSYGAFAQQTGLFDEIIIDSRPKASNIKGWIALRRLLRAGGFHRVYDLQTSDRSSLYSWLFRPGPMPQWSGIAWRCSHPHANLGRYPQHTIDKQAEQLLMAGIHPVPLPKFPPVARTLPAGLEDGSFALLIPGSSSRHLKKRWPAKRYAELARRLHAARCVPVVVGAPSEQDLAETIKAECPQAVDLVGQTDLAALAALAQGAAVTIGNDTGVTHIAAAGGNPVVVLFSSGSEPSRCAPRGGVVRVLVEAELADLPVDTVFAATTQVMNAILR